MNRIFKRTFTSFPEISKYRKITDNDLFWLKSDKMKKRNFLYSHPSLERDYLIEKKKEGLKNIMGNVYFGENCEGKPNYVHGGAISAILDEVMGFTCFINGLNLVTSKLEVTYKKPIHIESKVLLSTLITQEEKNIVVKSLMINDHTYDILARGVSTWKSL